MTERERLKELIREAEAKCESTGQCRLCEQYGKGGDCQRELIADHLLANGVIVPPCKVGDTVYDAGEFFLEGCSCPEIYELNDDEMTVHKRRGNLERRFTYDGMYIGHDDIGKHIFLTKEEAEKALERRQKWLTT